MINLNFFRAGNFVNTTSGYWQITESEIKCFSSYNSEGKLILTTLVHKASHYEGKNWQEIEINETTIQHFNFTKKKERLYEMTTLTGNIIEIELFLNKYEKHIMLKINQTDLGMILVKELHKIQNLFQLLTNEELPIRLIGDTLL